MDLGLGDVNCGQVLLLTIKVAMGKTLSLYDLQIYWL